MGIYCVVGFNEPTKLTLQPEYGNNHMVTFS